MVATEKVNIDDNIASSISELESISSSKVFLDEKDVFTLLLTDSSES